MITEIKEAELDVMENPYPGMNLAEACNKFQMDTMQLMNDFQMGVLLSEHAYLYENGTEIEYVDEAGNLTEKGKALKDKAVTAIQKIGAWVAELWDKCIQWVSERLAQVAQYFQKASISKKHVAMAGAAIDKIYPNGLMINGVKQTVANYDYFYGKVMNNPDAFDNTEKILSNIAEYDGEYKVTRSIFDNAAAVVFDKTNVVKQIRTKKNEMVKGINEQIKALKATKLDSENADNVEAEITDKMDYAKKVSAGASAAIKVYHAYVAQQIAIIRGVFADKEIKKEVMNQIKTDVKAAPGKDVEAGKEAANKAGTAVKDAGKAVGNAAKAAPGAVKDADNKAGTAVKDAGKAVGNAAKAAPGAIKGAAGKAGKFFKVPGKKEEA